MRCAPSKSEVPWPSMTLGPSLLIPGCFQHAEARLSKRGWRPLVGKAPESTIVLW